MTILLRSAYWEGKETMTRIDDLSLILNNKILNLRISTVCRE